MQRLFGALLISLGFAQASSSAQVVLYDNLAPSDWETLYPADPQNPGTDEIGDEIVLAAGTPRVVDRYQLQYFTQSLSGDEQIRIRFYRNDGPVVDGAASPNFPLYDSGNMSIAPVDGRQLLSLSGLNVTVPDQFTWSVQFSGLTTGERAGIAIAGPAAVGNNEIEAVDAFWENRNGSWGLYYFDTTPAQPSSFGVQFAAVPEPLAGTALTALALLAYGTLRKFKAC